MSRLSNYLTIQRRRTGRSMVAVAGIVGVTKSTIHRYENGAAVPPLDRCGALAEGYDVPVSALQPMMEAAQVTR